MSRGSLEMFKFKKESKMTGSVFRFLFVLMGIMLDD